MAIVVGSAITLSTNANTKSADLVSGTYQFVGKGKFTIIAKGSAAGMNLSFLVGGIALVNDQPIPYSGTTGTLSVNDNVMCSQVMNGGRLEMFIRNTSGGALTTDYLIYFEPM